MNPTVAPELFDILIRYARDIKSGKVKPKRSVGSTSPALVFCENFYAQFFQNKLGKEIKGFNMAAKKEAIGFRLDAKEGGSPGVVIRLITWYEKLCDIYPTVLALGYGTGSKTAFAEFHNGYLMTLLQRIVDWSRLEGYPDIEQRASDAITALKDALQSASI